MICNFQEFINENNPGPKSYYTGLSKSTATKRATQIKKQTAMSDDDPDAYKKLPGDSKKTKTSKYTKKFKEIFGEAEVNEDFAELGNVPGMGNPVPPTSNSTGSGDAWPSLGEPYSLVPLKKAKKKRKKKKIKESLVQGFQDWLLESQAIGNASVETALKNKLEKIKEKNPEKYKNVTLGILRSVMRRGMAAWKTGHRPGAGQEQWGYARVNSFLTGGKTIGTTANPGPDGDLGKKANLI